MLQPLTELEDEVQLTSRIAGWFNRLVMPLQQALRICDAAVLFRVSSSWKEKYFRRDRLRVYLAACNFRGIPPKISRLRKLRITYHEPIERSQSLALQRPVHRTHRGVLTHNEIALYDPIGHIDHGIHVRMIRTECRQVVVAPVVFRRRC